MDEQEHPLNRIADALEKMLAALESIANPPVLMSMSEQAYEEIENARPGEVTYK